MAIFCPDAAAWGDAGTWVAGIGTLFVGVLAWRTSKKATEISKQAQTIAEQHWNAAERERNATAKIIARFVHVELSAIPIRAYNIFNELCHSATWAAPQQVTDIEVFEYAIANACEDMLTACGTSFDRFHFLPESLGADLATLLSSMQAINHSARLAEQAIIQSDYVGHGRYYSGDPRQLVALRNQVALFTLRTLEVANELQAFLGLKGHDYSMYRTAVVEAQQRDGLLDPG